MFDDRLNMSKLVMVESGSKLRNLLLNDVVFSGQWILFVRLKSPLQNGLTDEEIIGGGTYLDMRELVSIELFNAFFELQVSFFLLDI